MSQLNKSNALLKSNCYKVACDKDNYILNLRINKERRDFIILAPHIVGQKYSSFRKTAFLKVYWGIY